MKKKRRFDISTKNSDLATLNEDNFIEVTRWLSACKELSGFINSVISNHFTVKCTIGIHQKKGLPALEYPRGFILDLCN